MTVTINGKTYAVDLREWSADLLITFVGFYFAREFILEEGVPFLDQPIKGLVVLGITAAVFKAARQWKAFK